MGALPPAAATRLFEALEVEARAGGDFPAAAMLAVLRPRIIEAGTGFPPRRPSAQRLFFTPFEDFFVAARRGRKRRARIARASIAPIWKLILEDAACADAARAAADLDAALARGDGDLSAYEAALFDEAATGLQRLVAHAETDAAFRDDLAARLGAGENAQAGAAALHDLAEVAALAPFAAYLIEAQRAFPRPLSSLTEEDLYAARRLYARAAAVDGDVGVYIFLAIAARLDAPWRALSLARHLAGAADDALPTARADSHAVIDGVFDDFETLARGLERDADDDPDTEDAAGRIEHFSTFAGGMADEAARIADGALGRRIEASRDIVASALARYCESALAGLRRALPTRHAGGSSRLMALRPDFARPIDRAADRDATQGALFLARADALAAMLERPAAAQAIVATAIAETRRYTGDLILEIRAAEGADRDQAKKRMEAVLKVVAPLLPASESALLKERAAAAAVSA